MVYWADVSNISRSWEQISNLKSLQLPESTFVISLLSFSNHSFRTFPPALLKLAAIFVHKTHTRKWFLFSGLLLFMAFVELADLCEERLDSLVWNIYVLHCYGDKRPCKYFLSQGLAVRTQRLFAPCSTCELSHHTFNELTQLLWCPPSSASSITWSYTRHIFIWLVKLVKMFCEINVDKKALHLRVESQ